jgi:hypothetical protein
MLAAYQLVPLLEAGSGGGGKCSSGGGSSPGRVVLSYWRKRALRLLPAYLATNLLFLLAVGPLGSAELSPEAALARDFSTATCPRGIGRNLLFLTNFNLDMHVGGCGESARLLCHHRRWFRCACAISAGSWQAVASCCQFQRHC